MCFISTVLVVFVVWSLAAAARWAAACQLQLTAAAEQEEQRSSERLTETTA